MTSGLRRLLSRKVASDVAATVTGSVFAKALAALTLLYVMRAVGANSFGLLTFGVSVIAYASIVVAPGMLVWGTRAVACEPELTKTYVVLINATQLILAAIAYATVVAISSAFFEAPEARIVTFAGASLFSVAVSVDWVYQGLQRFRLLSLGQVVSSVIALIATVAVVRRPGDVYYVPLLTAVGQIVAAFFLIYVLWRSGAIAGAIEWKRLGSMLRSSIPLGVSLMLVTILHYANNLALQFFRGSYELGIFAAPYRVFELCCLLPGLTANVFLPRIASETDPVRKQNELRTLVRVLVSGGALLALVMSLEARPLVHLLFGDKFVSSVPVLRVLGVALVFSFAAIAYITGLLGYRRDRAYFWSLFVPMTISVLGALFAVPRFGVMGATFTVAVLDLTTLFVCFVVYRAHIGRTFIEAWYRPFASVAASAVVLLLLQYAGVFFVLRLLAVTVVYGAMVVPWGEIRRGAMHELGTVGGFS